MDDLTRWKMLGNLILSIRQLMDTALSLIQEKVRESEAKGQESTDAVMKKIQETSRGVLTFGGKAYPPPSVETAKGSSPEPALPTTQGQE